MYVKMLGLYGGGNHDAWYRKIGIYCFDFVNSKEYASDMTAEECQKILSNEEWYCNQYKANKLIVTM